MKRVLKAAAFFAAVTLILSSFSLCASAIEYVTAGTKGETTASQTYMASKYYTYLSDIDKTGDQPTDVLAVALSQLGYRESNTFDDLDGLDGGDKNFTEYNYNFGDYNAGYGYDWCASFVSFCLLQSGTHDLNTLKDWARDHKNDPEHIWRELGCEKWRIALANVGYFKTSQAYAKETRLSLGDFYDKNYTPESGDLIFFTESQHKTSSHIGIVLYTDGERVYTVEGNTDAQSTLEGDGDGVYIKSYKLGDYYIVGYGDMPYSKEKESVRVDYSGNKPTSGAYMTRAEIPLYNNVDGALEKRETAESHKIPQYSMISVGSIDKETGLYLCEAIISGKKVTGYIYGKDVTVQLSQEKISLTVPPEPLPQKESGCGSAIYMPTVFIIAPLMVFSGIWLLKKKRTR